MATFALIHGGGGSAWDWHLVAPELQERGQQVVAVDLPSDDESAGWWDYADAVVDAIGDRSELVVVGHSLGGFTAPLVCARVPVDLVVLLAAMIPTRRALLGLVDQHRLSRERVQGRLLPRHRSRAGCRGETARTGREFPGAARAVAAADVAGGPDEVLAVSTACPRRVPPARRHARERLGIEPDEIDGGHYVTLSRPRMLADRLAAYAAGTR